MDLRIQAVIQLLTANLSRPLTLEDMAAHVRLSTSRLRHLFEENTGKTPARYLRSIRMAEARRLLATTFLTPKEIMFKVGIANQSQFIRDFRHDSNLTPTQFRLVVQNLSNDSKASGGNDSVVDHNKIEAVLKGIGPESGLAELPKPKLGSGNELRDSDELFFRVFNSYPQPMTITDMETGKFLHANDCYLNSYGYSREGVIGHTSLELGMWLSPADRKRMVAMLAERGQINQLELEFRISSGAIRVALYSAKVLEINGRKCILGLSHDITDHRLAYDRLLTEKKKLEEKIVELSSRQTRKKH